MNLSHHFCFYLKINMTYLCFQNLEQYYDEDLCFKSKVFKNF